MLNSNPNFGLLFSVVLHQFNKTVKQKCCIMRTAASFRMELNRESRHICVVYALTGVIITVYKAYFAVFGHTVAYNSVAVVL